MPAALNKRIDWPVLFGQWITAKAQGMTLTAFAESVKHPAGYLGTKFKEMQLEMFKDKMANVFEKGVDIVNKSLDSLEVNPDFALKATVQMADRIGLNPQQTQANINIQTEGPVVLFSNIDQNLVKNMLGADENETKTSPSSTSENVQGNSDD